jgi:hypothetical protein
MGEFIMAKLVIEVEGVEEDKLKEIMGYVFDEMSNSGDWAEFWDYDDLELYNEIVQAFRDE